MIIQKRVGYPLALLAAATLALAHSTRAEEKSHADRVAHILCLYGVADEGPPAMERELISQLNYARDQGAGPELMEAYEALARKVRRGSTIEAYAEFLAPVYEADLTAKEAIELERILDTPLWRKWRQVLRTRRKQTGLRLARWQGRTLVEFVGLYVDANLPSPSRGGASGK